MGLDHGRLEHADEPCGLGLREGAGGAEEHRGWRAAGRWVPLGLTPECQG